MPKRILGDAGDRRYPVGRVVGQQWGHSVESVGELGDELIVGCVGVDDEPQEPVEQGHVGARTHRQIEVGLRSGGGTARIDDDELRALLDPVHHPQEQDGMTVGHVGADHQEDVGVV